MVFQHKMFILPMYGNLWPTLYNKMIHIVTQIHLASLYVYNISSVINHTHLPKI